MQELKDHEERHIPRNARYGLVLFTAYVIVYALFVYLSAFRADVMAWQPLGGVDRLRDRAGGDLHAAVRPRRQRSCRGSHGGRRMNNHVSATAVVVFLLFV